MNKNIFYKKSVLVTGGSGSIGSGIIKSLIKKNCKVIRVLSNDENGIYELSEQINNLNKKLRIKMINHRIRYLVGDIRDLKRCILATSGIDIVIHAAALKHVPICEYNKDEAYKTNVLGTKNLIKAAVKNKIKKFLFISTDKAADPTSIMGKSKLAAERLIIKANKEKIITKFSVIRFGNILFSRGSVVFKFLQQIKSNQKITVTGLTVSRFFISISDAVNRISESILLMRGGEIFIVMKMQSFMIIDLAKAIKLIYKKNNTIQIIGLREGEKKYEKLVSSRENLLIHKKSKNLGIVIKNKKITKKNGIKTYTDSRFSKHLNSTEIMKILNKENFLRNDLSK
tara:strand:+ start:2709 stop:3734 length:1026 start_codon:yes stop_codon:yes gene_type:complete